jgi:hypothetical protein
MAGAKLDAKTPTLTPLQPAKSFFRAFLWLSSIQLAWKDLR